MSKVRFHRPEAQSWRTVRSLAVPEILHRFSDSELESTLFIHEPGDGDSLQLLEVRYVPNVDVGSHAHHEEGIYYVLSGELRVGARVVAAGDSVFVSRDTLYNLKAGKDGAHFLVFRPRADLSYISQEAFLARRQAEKTSAKG